MLKKENGKDDQNFLYREIEAGSRTGVQVEWMQNELIEEGKAGSLSRLRLLAPPRVPLWATRHYLHAYTNCSVPMKPTRSKNYMLALIVINQMGIRSQALSSRQRAPPSVYPSANEIRVQPHVGKSRAKWSVAACGRRHSVGARQGHRQREDRLCCRVDMEHCCMPPPCVSAAG